MISLELLVTAALLMVGIVLMRLFRQVKGEDAGYPAKLLWLVFASGAGVGLLTGILGAVLIPLDQKGFKIVYNVSGGTGAWRDSGLALERP
jgi:hypothetical protein